MFESRSDQIQFLMFNHGLNANLFYKKSYICFEKVDTMKTGHEVIKLFSSSTQLSMKF